MTSTMIDGGRLAIARLLHRRAALVLTGTALATIGVATAERGILRTGASTRTLEGVVFGVLIPLVTFGVVRLARGGARVDEAVAPLARWGMSRRPIAAGLAGASMFASAVAAAVLAALGSLAARDPQVASLASDAFSAAWIGALTGASYAATFALGATFGTKGRGAIAWLVLDLFVGGSGTFLSLPFPRAHALNLLGGQPPALLSHWLSQGQSGALLVALAAAALVATAARCPP